MHLKKPRLGNRHVIEALDLCYKELNELWEKAERDLRQVPIPEDVFIIYHSEAAYPEEGPGGPQILRLLGFVRSKGGWRICFGSCGDDDPMNDPDWKPITECSIDIRTECVPYISELREKVLQVGAEECVPKLHEAIGKLRTQLESW